MTVKNVKAPKEFTLIIERKGRTTEIKDTIQGLKEYCRYTLECGISYEHEKGNKKINRDPKTIGSLITTLNNSASNRASNGNPSSYYYKG